MKKLLATLTGGILVVSAVSGLAAESCIKCHKSMDKVAEVVKRSGVKSADELVDFLRNKSAKKGIHKTVKDEDIRKAYNEVAGKGTGKEAPKRKKVEGC